MAEKQKKASREKKTVKAKKVAEKAAPPAKAAEKKEEAKTTEAKKQASPNLEGIDAWGVIKFPHLSEKSIANIETQNKLVFIVESKASRRQIKDAVEKAFQVKVVGVNMLTTSKGEKKAFVRLDEKSSAADIATRLGMM